MKILKINNLLNTRLIRFCFCGVILLFIHQISVADSSSSHTFKPYSVTLKLEREGLNAGTMDFELQSIKKKWLAKTSFHPSKLAKILGVKKTIENTQFTCTQVQCFPYLYIKKSKNTYKNIYFNHQKKSYRDSHKELGETPNSFQTNQSFLASIIQDLQQNKLKDQYIIFNENKFTNYTLVVKHDQILEINKKKINTSQITLVNGKKKNSFWLAESLNWAPVRIENYKKGKVVLKGTFKETN